MANQVSTSTAKYNSQERLECILGIYPVLESILSSSHRSNLIGLGQTRRSIRRILTSIFGPLPKSFPNCTEDMRRYSVRHTSICIDCG